MTEQDPSKNMNEVSEFFNDPSSGVLFDPKTRQPVVAEDNENDVAEGNDEDDDEETEYEDDDEEDDDEEDEE